MLVTDIRNCAVAAGFATALSPCPAHDHRVGGESRPRARAFVTGPENTVTACVEDLALDGFANRTCEQRQVWVDNACPPRPSAAAPRSAPASATGGDDRGTIVSDRPAVVRGRVAGAGAGATVCALTRVLIDGQPMVVGATATTGADGSYALELPPGRAARSSSTTSSATG